MLSLWKIVWKRFVWNDLERFDVRKACINVRCGKVFSVCESEIEKDRENERREGGSLYQLSGEEKYKY